METPNKQKENRLTKLVQTYLRRIYARFDKLDQKDILTATADTNKAISWCLRFCAVFVFGLILYNISSSGSRKLPDLSEEIISVSVTDDGDYVVTSYSDSLDQLTLLFKHDQLDYWDQQLPDSLGAYVDISVNPSNGDYLLLKIDSASDRIQILLSRNNQNRPNLAFSASYVLDFVEEIKLKFDWETNYGYLYVGFENLIQDEVKSFGVDYFKLIDNRLQEIQISGASLQTKDTTRRGAVWPIDLKENYLYFLANSGNALKYNLDDDVIEATITGVGLDAMAQTMIIADSMLFFQSNKGTFSAASFYDDRLRYQITNVPSQRLLTASNEMPRFINNDGRLIMFYGASIYSVARGAGPVELEKLPDSVIIRQADFNWETGNGILIAESTEGLDKVYLTRDFGSSWKETPLYRRGWFRNPVVSFALWIGLLIATIWGVYYYLKRRHLYELLAEKRKRATQGMVSDNPVERDTLGVFTPTKKALVQLIKNKDTQPPVTIAINGSWGSGKSSLMSMIRKDLEEESKSSDGDYLTIWFNIWHFESEKHLLTVFLSKMVEKFEKSIGWAFRLNLFFNKVRALKPFAKFRFYFFIFMIAPFVLFLLNSLIPEKWPFFPDWPTFDLTDITVFNRLFDALATYNHVLFQNQISKDNVLNMTWLPLTGILILVGIFSLRKDLVPSGLGSFLNIFPLEELRKKTLEEDPGFRDKYKKEFWRLLEATDPRKKIIVFVDDIDRVNGNKVKQILEGINFIADTASRPEDVKQNYANMYFILGMATEQVVANLGKRLEEDQIMNRENLGLRFLEKMIDLTVQVPPVHPKDYKELNKLFRTQSE